MEMNRTRLLCKKCTVNAAWANNALDRARSGCEGDAQSFLRTRRKLSKRRDANSRTDDKVATNRTARTRLDVKMSVCENISLWDSCGVGGNHLRRLKVSDCET
jgi:hypothetical protein